MPQSKSIYGRGGHQNCNRFYGSTPLNLIISADGFKSIQVVTNPYGDDLMTLMPKKGPPHDKSCGGKF